MNSVDFDMRFSVGTVSRLRLVANEGVIRDGARWLHALHVMSAEVEGPRQGLPPVWLKAAIVWLIGADIVWQPLGPPLQYTLSASCPRRDASGPTVTMRLDM